MTTDLLQSVASNVWAIFLVVLFFGGSIFVHELGHFLAARRRGVHVERFSIGFGPAIWSRRGKDGVEYRLAVFPLGGYVLLPQLADLGAIEGESRTDTAKLPPPSYSTKMLVFVAGAAFNILFALVLACIVWGMGQPESSATASTRIGYIVPHIDLPDGTKFQPSPATRAGLQVGDTIHRIDGGRVSNWNDVRSSLILSSGRTQAGARQVILDIERDGVRREIAVEPVLATDEKLRQIGISSGFELIVQAVPPESTGAKAGFQANDEILRLDSTLMLSNIAFESYLFANAGRPIAAVVRRAGQEVTLTIPPRPEARQGSLLGMTLTTGFRIVHVPPHQQLVDVVRWTIRTFQSLLSRSSDIGLDKMSGPMGIAQTLHRAATVGIGAVLMITILLNINLAIFNLLPIPVLDGGQMLFATIARLRGRALPVNLVAGLQSAFMVLLLAMVAYVTVAGDINRTIRENRAERAAEAKAAEQQPAPPKK